MATAMALPISVDYGTDGRVFPNQHVTDTNSRAFNGHGVAASLTTSDVDMQLEFDMSPTLPTGTAKLVCRAIAFATSGDADINIRWKSFANEEDTDVAKTSYPAAEGVQNILWGAGDDDQYKEVKFTLDSDTVVASEQIHMYVTFEYAGWGLAAVSTWKFYIIWE